MTTPLASVPLADLPLPSVPIARIPFAAPPQARTARRFHVVALIALAWAIALAVIAVRAAYSPGRNTVITTYFAAGERWLAGEKLYFGPLGFVYSPPVAALFAPFSQLPAAYGGALWRLLNAGIFAAGALCWLRAEFHSGIPKSWHPWAFLLLLPLALGNFNNGQANPLVIGLLLIAFVAADRGRFTVAAICVAIATYFKIYPLALGLLLAVLYPRRFTWRLVLALALTGGAAFLLQQPYYVLAQYRLWFETRAADNRLRYAGDIAPRDLWLLLRFAHIPVTEAIYRVIQLGSAAAIAFLCFWGRWKNWPRERLIAAAFSLGCVWMLLCGPATESVTYIMLAPALIFALLQACATRVPWPRRSLLLLSFAILIAALTVNAFVRLKKSPLTMSPQPLSALVFAGYAVMQAARPSGAGARPARK